MNNVKDLFNSISEEELREAINEIYDAEITGILSGKPVLAKYNRLFGDITGAYNDLNYVQLVLLRISAYRSIGKL